MKKYIFLCLISSMLYSGTAFAEGAWIVWKAESSLQHPEDTSWYIQEALPTYNDCVKEEKRLSKNLLEFNKHASNVKNSAIETRSGADELTYVLEEDEGDTIRTLFVCLPDTFDPKDHDF